MAKSLADCRLYAFVDSAYLNGRDPLDITAQLCEGGADLIQLRAKDWPRDKIARTAQEMLPVCEMNGVLLVVNDYPDVAQRVGAPLAHLGQEDFFGSGFHQLSELSTAPNAPKVGMSTHAPDQASRAVAAGAAYIAIGPVYATPTKPGRPPVTVEYVRWAAGHILDVPWFAIGGITLANLDEVLAAGARRVCVVSAILNANNVSRACREFRARLPS